MKTVLLALAYKNDIRDAAGLNLELLQKNDDYDLVKATVDDDGDYLLRMDLPPAGHDGKSFNAQLVQIATARTARSSAPPRVPGLMR